MDHAIWDSLDRLAVVVGHIGVGKPGAESKDGVVILPIHVIPNTWNVFVEEFENSKPLNWTFGYGKVETLKEYSELLKQMPVVKFTSETDSVVTLRVGILSKYAVGAVGGVLLFYDPGVNTGQDLIAAVRGKPLGKPKTVFKGKPADAIVFLRNVIQGSP